MSNQRNNEMRIKLPIEIDRAVALITTEEEISWVTGRHGADDRYVVGTFVTANACGPFTNYPHDKWGEERKRDRRMSLHDWVASRLPHRT